LGFQTRAFGQQLALKGRQKVAEKFHLAAIVLEFGVEFRIPPRGWDRLGA
jgi:hypothetical protein